MREPIRYARAVRRAQASLGLAAGILRIAGLRAQAPPIVAAAVDIRNGAFTLASRSYNQVRRAVTHARCDDRGVEPSEAGKASRGWSLRTETP